MSWLERDDKDARERRANWKRWAAMRQKPDDIDWPFAWLVAHCRTQFMLLALFDPSQTAAALETKRLEVEIALSALNNLRAQPVFAFQATDDETAAAHVLASLSLFPPRR